MTKQVIVCEDRDDVFYRNCSNLLKDGYKVIPGTVSCSTSIAMHGSSKNSSDILIAFFEKEIVSESIPAPTQQ